MPSTDVVSIHMINHGSLAITIPKQIAKELNLQKGMKLRAKAKDGKLEFKQIRKDERKHLKELAASKYDTLR